MYWNMSVYPINVLDMIERTAAKFDSEMWLVFTWLSKMRTNKNDEALLTSLLIGNRTNGN